MKSQSGGNVFALNGAETTKSDHFIRGAFVNGIHLIAIIDTCTTYSFIYLDYAKNFNLEISSMVGSMVIDTLVNGSMNNLLVCLKCPLTIYGKDFGIDLYAYR